jgi:hypothetical protein
MTAADRLAQAAAEVRTYWRDWPQERRDRVRALSSFLADAIEALALEVESSPRGVCGECHRSMGLTKGGVLRQHNGDVYIDGWRQICAGVGELPEVAS